ncbi:hypothetical protein P3W85_36615, partial [Cupriavidus basilensis]
MTGARRIAFCFLLPARRGTVFDGLYFASRVPGRRPMPEIKHKPLIFNDFVENRRDAARFLGLRDW